MKIQSSPRETYLSDTALAARFGVTRPTIWRWARLGPFPKPVKLSPGCTRWRVAEVEAFETRMGGAVQ